jgi:hypothetical protein
VRTRLIALLVSVTLVTGVLVAVLATQGDGGVRVQAGGDPTSVPDTTTTQTPVTPSTTVAPIVAPIPVVTTEPTTVPPTTVPPAPDTTVATAPSENEEAAEIPAAAAPVPAAVTPDQTQPAVRTETGVCISDPAYCNPPPEPERWAIPGWARCPQWWPTAQDVGWSEGDMQVLDYIMNRESGCDPHARNPSPCAKGNHAMGLTQLCGWLPAYLAYDPAANLSKALELRRTQGWCPWVLRGDRVTGRACG